MKWESFTALSREKREALLRDQLKSKAQKTVERYESEVGDGKAVVTKDILEDLLRVIIDHLRARESNDKEKARALATDLSNAVFAFGPLLYGWREYHDKPQRRGLMQIVDEHFDRKKPIEVITWALFKPIPPGATQGDVAAAWQADCRIQKGDEAIKRRECAIQALKDYVSKLEEPRVE